MSHRRRDSGLWHADDFMLAYDGSTDVSAELDHIFTSVMAPGDTFAFRPDGQYRCEDGIILPSIEDITVLGNNACLFNTIEFNSAFFLHQYCRNIEYRNLHLFGYKDFDNTGSQLTPGTGTPTISGTTMQLNAQNESVFVIRGGVNNAPYALARDKDGYCHVLLTLSDSAQVANDCVIVVKNQDGVLLETITIPVLTGTPVVYDIAHKLADPRDRVDWEIKKSTGSSNTITITFCKTISAGAYLSSNEFNAGWKFAGCHDMRIFDCSAEGVGGDAVETADTGGDHVINTNILIRGFLSRACGRQGISFSVNRDLRFEDFDIYFPGRSGIDVEPESFEQLCNEVNIVNGRIYDSVNNGISAINWFHIDRLHVRDVEIFDSGRAAIEGGSCGGGGSFVNVTSNYVHHVDQGALWPDFMVKGVNMRISDCTAARGFYFMAHTVTRTDGAILSTGGNTLIGHKVTWQGNYGAVGVEPGTTATVIGGSGPEISKYGNLSVYPGVGPAGGLRRAVGLDLEAHQDRYPETYGGGIGYSHLWSPFGHDFVKESAVRLGAISGGSTAVTLQTLTARTTTGTTTAVDAGEATHARFRLYLTAVSGTTPSLVVDIQQSHDNTTFTTIDTFPTMRGDAGAQWSKVIEFRNTARYLRLSYTIAGTSPSFTFSVIGDVSVAGNNLRLLNAAVTASATTHTWTFPTRPHVNPLMSFNGSLAVGTLTPSTTYYYRIAGRPIRGGPNVANAEQSVATGAGLTSMILQFLQTESVAAGIQIQGITVYRGTSTGVYTHRFDALPRTPFSSTPAGGTYFTLTDLGLTMTIDVATNFPSKITLGYPASVPAKIGSFTPADETGYELDTNYDVWVTTNWNSGHPYITSKTRSACTATFPNAAPGDGSGRVSLELIR